MKIALGALFCGLLLGGCTGTYSTIESQDRAYAVTRQQALQIVDGSVRASVSPKQVRDEMSHALSCAGRMQFLFISTNVHAVAVRLNGTTANGKIKEGYGFIVTYWGNIPFPQTPRQVYRLMQEKAGKEGEALTVSKEEQRKARLDVNYLRLLRP